MTHDPIAAAALHDQATTAIDRLIVHHSLITLTQVAARIGLPRSGDASLRRDDHLVIWDALNSHDRLTRHVVNDRHYVWEVVA